jgi:hypothetical protein
MVKAEVVWDGMKINLLADRNFLETGISSIFHHPALRPGSRLKMKTPVGPLHHANTPG